MMAIEASIELDRQIYDYAVTRFTADREEVCRPDVTRQPEGTVT